MSQESSDALHVGVGVAATCIGVLCSLYTCCCHVWRRLKGHTPVVAAGAAVAAGSLAAGQLASVLGGVSQNQGHSGVRSDAPCFGDSQDRCPGEDPGLTCRTHVVSIILSRR
jgi:hypothetical protein